MAQIITISSQKGGVGKSTLTVHLAVHLHNRGKKVCVIDCDDQGTSLRYLENRKCNGLAVPHYFSKLHDIKTEVKSVSSQYDTIIIDTPAGRSESTDAAHSISDTILTVFNDSFADLDVLARIDNAKSRSLQPQNYSEGIWNHRKNKLASSGKPQNWILVLNRVGQVTKNRTKIMQLVDQVVAQWGVKFGGFVKERVGYRSGFLSGLTSLDPQSGGLTASHVSARIEIRQIAALLKLGEVRI